MRSSSILSSLLLTTSFALLSMAYEYRLDWELRGADFLNEFDYWDSGTASDPTSNSKSPSAAYYMPKGAAQQQGLVSVEPNGNFRLGVDSTFVYQGSNLRPSVRIMSQKTVGQGLLIIDAAHLPYGITSWPAIWLTDASQTWPNGGEIDIYEGIGNISINTMSYHTTSGCSYDSTVKQTGILSTVSLNCDALLHGDEACGSRDPNQKSFGAGANIGGGSVYVFEWSPDAMKMYHFNRANVPQDITNGNPTPSGWGAPVTYLASTNCDFEQFFGPQSLIINVDICGTWAGAVYPDGPQACFEYAQSHPEAFETAYFEITSIKHYVSTSSS